MGSPLCVLRVDHRAALRRLVLNTSKCSWACRSRACWALQLLSARVADRSTQNQWIVTCGGDKAAAASLRPHLSLSCVVSRRRAR